MSISATSQARKACTCGLPAAPGGLQLYGWTAIDAQNKRTTVKLSDVRYNVAVPESAFTYAEPKKRKR